ncbi:MAG: voltage-gated potassium channel [Limisphaerales bacterium]|jgi:voltage-gated potassium channel
MAYIGILLNKTQTTRYLSMRVAFFMVFFSLALGILGFMVLEGYTFEEACYMAITTISTVGYSEVRPLERAGRIFVSIYIVLNIGIFAYLVSAFSYYVVEGQIFKRMHSNYIQKEISALRNHVILCGYGRHGKEAVSHFQHHDIEFVVIERDEERIEALRKAGILYLKADATEDDVLVNAGIIEASTIITALPDDTDNVFTALTARASNPTVSIIARSNRAQTYTKLKMAGANYIIQPEQIGGFYMATLVTKPSAIEFFTFITNQKHHDVGFDELHYDQMPKAMQNKAIRDLTIRPVTGANIIGMKNSDGSYSVNPSPDVIIEPGSSIIVLGNAAQIKAFWKYVNNDETVS